MRHRQTPEVRAPRRINAGALLLLVVIAVGIVLLSGWLASDASPDHDGPVVVDRPEAVDRKTALAAAPESEPEELSVDAEGSAAASAIAAGVDPEELLEEYPRVTVSGRVVLLSPGEMPPDLSLVAARQPPAPVVRRLNLATILDLPSDFDAISGGALRERTRTTVGPDGRFEMPDFPLNRLVWIDAETSEWYQPRARLHGVPATGGELIIELARGATIRGQVIDGDGLPVVGLKVVAGSTLEPYAIAEGNALIVRMSDAVSDADGRFEFAPTPTDVPLMLSNAAQFGFQPTAHEVAALMPGEATDEVVVVVGGSVIEGVVIDVDDQPVPDTSVSIQPSTLDMGNMDLLGLRAFDKTRKTDDEGRFRFDCLPDGSYQLSLSKGGYRSIPTEAIEVLGGQVVSDVLLRADRGLSVSGRVTGPDGEAVVEARVTGFVPPSLFSMRANKDREYRATEQVDSEGRFSLWGYDEGQVRVLAEAEGHVMDSVDVAAGASDVGIRLQRKATISGIAIDLSTGDPMTSYKLRIMPSGGLFNMAALTEMDQRMGNLRAPLDVSDDDGRFVMDDVTPDTYDIVLTADGYAQTNHAGVEVVVGADTSGVILLVHEEASVIGQVLSGRTGQPLQDVTVTTGKTDALSTITQMLAGPVPKTRTDVEGRFALGGLGDEQLTVTLQHEHHRSAVLADLWLRPGEVHDAGLISLPPGGTIHGTVFGPDAQPQAGVSVRASDALGKQMRRATTESDGSYRISGLESGTINVMRLDFSLSMDSENLAGMLEGLTYETVILELDEVKRVDLGTPSALGCRLEGVVRSAGGPEPDAMVIVVREDGPPASKFSSTNDAGHYEIEDLQPGHYLMQVMPSSSMGGGGSQPTSAVMSTLVIGDEPSKRHDVDVPGAVLRGEVRARRGVKRLPSIRVLLDRVDEDRPESRYVERMGGRVGEAYTDGQGEFRFEHLPAGTYAVQAGGTNLLGLGEAGWAVSRVDDIAVREGREGFKVVVELDPGGAVTGIARGPNNQPLVNVPVWARSDETGRWMSVLSEINTETNGRYTVNSLEPGSWTLAFGGDAWALTLVEGVRVRAEVSTERDVELEQGVEVFAELGPYRSAQLSVQIHGPQGAVPTELTSLTALMAGQSSAAGRLRLGRLARGTYDLALFADGAPILQDVVHIGKHETEVVVSLVGDE